MAEHGNRDRIQSDDFENSAGAERRPGVFSAPEVERAFVEDPLFHFLKTWSKPLLTAALVVLAAFYINDRLNESKLEARGQAAAIYAKLREEYSALNAAADRANAIQDDNKDEGPDSAATPGAITQPVPAPGSNAELAEKASKALDLTKALSDRGESSAKVAELYRALIHWQQGTPIAVSEVPLPPVSDVRERFFAELKHGVAARAALDNPETKELGLKRLKYLTDEGEFVAVSAGLTLARLATSPEEKAAVQATLHKLSERLPEQASIVSEELKKLGLQ